jgi:hypothetical protein
VAFSLVVIGGTGTGTSPGSKLFFIIDTDKEVNNEHVHKILPDQPQKAGEAKMNIEKNCIYKNIGFSGKQKKNI